MNRLVVLDTNCLVHAIILYNPSVVRFIARIFADEINLTINP